MTLTGLEGSKYTEADRGKKCVIIKSLLRYLCCAPQVFLPVGIIFYNVRGMIHDV